MQTVPFKSDKNNHTAVKKRFFTVVAYVDTAKPGFQVVTWNH